LMRTSVVPGNMLRVTPRLVDKSFQPTIIRYQRDRNVTGKETRLQPQTDFEKEVADLIVESLNLEDIEASEIEPEEALFGDGLALDSIDALELALAITQKYSVQLKADDANVREVFSSLRSLSAYIQEHRA
jgi:acyl carrier protein